MNNAKHIAYSKYSSPFLVLTLLFVCHANTSLAQVKPAAPNIANTVWKGPITPFQTSAGTATSQAFFLFEKDGKVTERAISMLASQLQATPNVFNPMYNPSPWIYQEGSNPYAYNSPFRYSLTMTPGPVASAEEIGTYKVTGRTLYVEFPSSTITATINGQEMIGASTNKQTHERKEWAIQRIPDAALRRQTDDTSFGAESPSSNATLWDFTLDVNRLVGSTGVFRDENRRFGWMVKLNLIGEDLTGTIINGRGEQGEDVCADATIVGWRRGTKVNFVVTYQGACCNQGQMRFTGDLSDDNKTMTGSLEPAGLPKTYSCSLAYAKVTANQR